MGSAPKPTPTPTPAPGPEAAPREPAGRVVAPREPFELSLGEAAGIRGTDLQVRFVSVEEDSRCPEGEQCIVAGKARIHLTVSERGERPAVVELSTAPGAGEAIQGKLAFELLGLTPHPSTKRSIQPADYRARLVVASF